MFAAIVAVVAQVTPPPPPPVLVTPAAPASPAASPFPQTSPSPAFTPASGTLGVQPASVSLSPAQQQIITVTGANAPLQATTDRKLVILAVDQSALTVTVTATQATGNDTIHVISGASRIDVPVRVAFAAGTVEKTATLKVTGSPVDPAWLAQQVASLVARLTLSQPGAQVAIAPVTPAPSPLVPGAQTQFTVPVQIAGGDTYLDVNDSTTVTVQNVDAGTFLPSLLFYDDDPERVNADGVLYRGTFDAARPVRLYFYHDNGPQARRVAVILSSQSQDPSSVQIIDSTAGPNIDVMSVGHATSKNFLLFQPRNQGTIVDLDSTPYVLHDLPMQYRQGVAGTVGLRVLAGGPVNVTVVAVSPGIDPRTLLSRPQLPDDGHHRTGIFSLANYGSANVSYAVGGPDAKFVYGDREPTPPNVAANSPGHDYGDYGVLWNIGFSLANPTSAPATVFLYERPIGGVVRSSFLLGNSLVDMGCVRVPQPYEVSAYTLQPNQTYRLNLQTMTDGGSNYPLEVGITQTPPQPTPPPISAPDGCFPKPQPPPSPIAVPSVPSSASPSASPSPIPTIEPSPGRPRA